MVIHRLKIAVLCSVLLAGCSSTDQDGAYDPFESVNRRVFEFNHSLDKGAALPAATYYKHALPDGLRTGLHNFLSNLNIPVTMANDLLQGDLTYAGYAACRLGVNTTVGILGIVDRATDMGCPSREEDFGQTLGSYGVPGGPYMVLPLIGSTLPRDIAGKLAVDHYFNPISYLQYNGKTYVGWGQNLIKVVDQRSRAVSSLREVERNSVDYYSAMRRLYMQRRNAAIHNEIPQPLAPLPNDPAPPRPTDEEGTPSSNTPVLTNAPPEFSPSR